MYQMHFGSSCDHGNAMVFEHESLPLLPASPRFEAVINIDSDEYGESECVRIGLFSDLTVALSEANGALKAHYAHCESSRFEDGIEPHIKRAQPDTRMYRFLNRCGIFLRPEFHGRSPKAFRYFFGYVLLGVLLFATRDGDACREGWLEPCGRETLIALAYLFGVVGVGRWVLSRYDIHAHQCRNVGTTQPKASKSVDA